MHANTRAKVTVCGASYMDKLEELIDVNDIPVEMGGKDQMGGLESQQEQALKEHVYAVLKEKDLQQPATL